MKNRILTKNFRIFSFSSWYCFIIRNVALHFVHNFSCILARNSLYCFCSKKYSAEKTATETVRLCGTSQRTGDSASPAAVQAGGKSLLSRRPKPVFPASRSRRFSPLSEAHMSVCSNRWYNESNPALVLLRMRVFLFVFSRNSGQTARGCIWRRMLHGKHS